MYDVIVVGAGPAGLNVSKRLGEKGFRVLLLEAKEEVGKDIICTGIIGKETFEEFNLPHSSIISNIQKLMFVSPFGTPLFYNHPSPFAFIVDREIFDKNLLKGAENAGTALKLRHKVVDVITEESSVKVICDTGSTLETFTGQVLVLATGVEYRLNKKLDLGYPVRFMNAVQKYVHTNTKNDRITLLVGNQVAKGGFGWIVPVQNGTARVGLVTEENPANSLGHLMEQYFPDEVDTPVHMKPIAQGVVSRTFSNRVVAVGEAAGQVKTTTGGGVYFSLICSEIASDVIEAAFAKRDFSRGMLSLYEKRWKEKVSNEIRTGLKVRKACKRLSDSQIEKVFNIIQSDGFFEYIAKNIRFDWHGSLITSLFKKISAFINT